MNVDLKHSKSSFVWLSCVIDYYEHSVWLHFNLKHRNEITDSSTSWKLDIFI